MARRQEPIYETLAAPLCEAFGQEWATKLFGRKCVEAIPLLKAGANRGKARGFVIWKKAVTAGYAYQYQMPVRPGQLVRAWIGETRTTPEGQAMTGYFMGRIQTICATATILFEDGRKRWMGEQWKEGE